MLTIEIENNTIKFKEQRKNGKNYEHIGYVTPFNKPLNPFTHKWVFMFINQHNEKITNILVAGEGQALTKELAMELLFTYGTQFILNYQKALYANI